MISGAVGPEDHESGGASTLGRNARHALYLVSVLGGTVRRLSGGGIRAALSPDDKFLAYVQLDPMPGPPERSSLWLADADGENPRPFIEAEKGEYLISPTWTPDGKRIVYRRARGDETTLASRGLDEESSVLLLRQELAAQGVELFRLEDFLMLDGRLVFARDEPAPRSRDRNLWELAVDPRSGEPQGEPKRLTEWVGLEIKGLSASADGSQLAFRDDHGQTDVWIGELADGGRSLDRVRRLTLDDRNDSPGYWSPDGRSLVFESTRHGNRDLFVQGLDERSARDLVVAPAMQFLPRPTPDGRFLLYWEMDGRDPSLDGPRRLFRVPVDGGPKELVLETVWPAAVQCASTPDGPCLLGEKRSEANLVTWSRLDPVAGRGEELWEQEARPPDPGVASLSPDGSRLAGVSGSAILVREIASGRTTTIQVAGLPGGTGIAWAADGSGFFVSSVFVGAGVVLVHVDLDGNARVLHSSREIAGLSAPTPSRDGRHLAFSEVTRESNLWLVEQF